MAIRLVVISALCAGRSPAEPVPSGTLSKGLMPEKESKTSALCSSPTPDGSTTNQVIYRHIYRTLQDLFAASPQKLASWLAVSDRQGQSRTETVVVATRKCRINCNEILSPPTD